MADHLSGAQLSAIEARVKAQITQVIEAMQLRKWAIEQVSKVLAPSDSGQIIALAAEVLTFITQPAQEIVVKIKDDQ